MKNLKITFATVLLGMGTIFGQDISAKEVPSVILNKFQKAFPKAYSVEWEKENGNYKVDFETGLGKDHKIWYNESASVIREKEDISKSSLPKVIIEQLNKDYSKYKVDDVSKITENGTTKYKVELDSFTKDLKLTFDSSGKMISSIED